MAGKRSRSARVAAAALGFQPGLSVWIMPRSDRRSYIPSGLAERIHRVRGDESFAHWVRHQLERQDSQLEKTRDRVNEGAE
jgi:hypothetical protein